MKDLKNLHPLDYLKILWRRRWYALSGFLLVSTGAGAYSYRIPDVYKSESKVLVERAVIPQDYVRPSDWSSPAEQINTIRQLVQSRSFLERLIQEFQLFGYGTSRDFSLERAITTLRNNIEITNTSQNTFSIFCTSANPQMAHAINRRLVETLIQSSNSSRRTRAAETEQFLDEQMRQCEQDLAAQEEKIKNFKTTYLGMLPQQSAANINALNGLNAQLAAVESAIQRAKDQQKLLDFRIQEQKRLGVLTSSLYATTGRGSKVETTTKSASSLNPQLAAIQAELSALLLKYTPNHPDVVRLTRIVEELKRQSPDENSEAAASEKTESDLATGQMEDSRFAPDLMLDMEEAEIKIEAEGLKSEIAKREKEKESILKQIKIYQQRLNLAPALEQELAALSRDRDALIQQYSNLQRKKFEARMTADLEANKSSDIYKVIDEANLPEKPVFPNRIHIALMGLGAGLVVGIGAAFAREMLDTTISSEEEALAVLNLPVLASIVEVPRKEPKRVVKIRGMAKTA